MEQNLPVKTHPGTPCLSAACLVHVNMEWDHMCCVCVCGFYPASSRHMHSKCAQIVHTKCTMSTHKVYNVYTQCTMCTQKVYKEYTQSALRVHTKCTKSTHKVYKEYTLLSITQVTRYKKKGSSLFSF